MNQTQFIAELAKLRPSSTFLNLHSYRSEASGEVAHFNLIFHISYENALVRSISTLEGIVPATDLQAQAKFEQLASFQKSLEEAKNTPAEEIDDAYTRFLDESGKHIKGVKLHTETSTLHLYGFVHNKITLVPGTYKEVKSRPLTIEKNKLRRMCAVSRFRQFRIVPSQVEKISVSGMQLLPPEGESE